MAHPLIKPPWLRWVLYVTIWTLIGLAFAAQAYLTRAEIGSPVPWRSALGRNLLDWYIFAILGVPVLWLAKRIPLELGDWKRRLTIHVAASIAFSLLWMVLRALASTQLGLTEGRGFWAVFTYALVATFFFNILVYWAIVSLGH